MPVALDPLMQPCSCENRFEICSLLSSIVYVLSTNLRSSALAGLSRRSSRSKSAYSLRIYSLRPSSTLGASMRGSSDLAMNLSWRACSFLSSSVICLY